MHLRLGPDPLRFARNLRELGHEFADLGKSMVDRATELDGEPPLAHFRTRSAARHKVNAIQVGSCSRVNVSS